MKIRVTETFQYEGETLNEGETHELPDSVAESAIERGFAEKAVEKDVPELDVRGEAKAKEDKEIKTAGGTDVGGFLKSGGGWLTAHEVEEGDTITIQGPGEIDEKTFDTPYLNIPVKHNGADYNLRLGKRNTKRIADKFGTDTSKWVGKKIRVVSIEDYPQLSSKGMILKPA